MSDSAIFQIVSIILFVFLILFLISIIDFMKRKTKTDEKILQALEKLTEKMPEGK